MKNTNNDWRLQGQENYLIGKTLVYKKYADRITSSDHDHCEFCSEKFSEVISECLTEGYTTTDDYHWICKNCYHDFKNDFRWTVCNQQVI